jgi:DNA replication protein DnaC
MLSHQTIELLHDLRLPAMAEALEEQRRTPDAVSLDFEDRLSLLLAREKSSREHRRLTRLLQLARLRHSAVLEDVNFRAKRGLDKSQFLRLATGEWIRQHEVLLITGPTGTGKSWLACALGHSACRQGLCVRYVRLPRLLQDLSIARSDGSYGRLLTQLGKADLLILDDWGLAPTGDQERRDLLEMIEDRTGRRATLITSQVPVDHWHELIGDATFGDAILDRIVHHAHHLTLTGGSLRKLENPERPTPITDTN